MSELAAQTAAEVPQSEKAAGLGDFARIVRDNQAMVFSIAYHFLHDRALAEDLAQDVFLQLHQNLANLASAAHVTHWLRKVTGHRCIDYSRRHGHGIEVDLDRAPEPASEGTFPDPLLRERLRKLVASLPERMRLLIILRYQEEMEIEEIARTLEVPAGTVRTQLFRTLAHLREKATRFLAEPLAAGQARGAGVPLAPRPRRLGPADK